MEVLEELKKPENLFLIFLVFVFFNFLAVCLVTLSYPYDVDYSEGFIISPTIRLLEGKPLYHNITSSLNPYSPVKYPPFFYLVNALTMLILGKNLLSARIISFLSSLGISALIFLLIKRKTNKNKLGVIASLLFLSSHVVFWLAPQARMDALAAFLSLTGVYLVLKKKRYYSLIPFSLALLTKQSYISAPIACSVYFFLNEEDKTKGLKKSLKFLGLLTLIVSSAFLLTDFLSNGRFIKHLTVYSQGIFFWNARKGLKLENFGNLFRSLRSLFLVLLISVYYFYKNPKKLLPLYLLFSLSFSIFKFLRLGGWVYYFFEFSMVASILTCLWLNEFDKPLEKSFLFLLLFLQILVFASSDPRILYFTLEPQNYPPLVNRKADRLISSYVQNSTGKVWIEHASYARANGKEVGPEPWSMVELQRSGFFNRSEFLGFMREQNYSRVIYYSRLKRLPGFESYLRKNYRKIDQVGWIDLAFHNRTWSVYERSYSSR